MSVVIVGGNERMTGQYESICRKHGCKVKVFLFVNGSMKKKLGCPDILILFTATVSHKMMISAVNEAKRNGVEIVRVNSSSASALNNALKERIVCA